MATSVEKISRQSRVFGIDQLARQLKSLVAQHGAGAVGGTAALGSTVTGGVGVEVVVVEGSPGRNSASERPRLASSLLMTVTADTLSGIPRLARSVGISASSVLLRILVGWANTQRRGRYA